MTQFGITDDGVKLTVLKNASTVEGAVNIYMKLILKNDYGVIPDEDGKVLTAANLQWAYEDWADTMIENMSNDGYKPGSYVINLDSMVDNWSNRSWIVSRENGIGDFITIGNANQYKLIADVFARKGVQEKEFSIE